MKAHELAELLLQNPEFEVEGIMLKSDSCTIDNPWPQYDKLEIEGIADIGYSDKKIILEIYSL